MTDLSYSAQARLLTLLSEAQTAAGIGKFDKVDRLLDEARRIAGSSAELQPLVEQTTEMIAGFLRAREAALAEAEAIVDDTQHPEEEGYLEPQILLGGETYRALENAESVVPARLDQAEAVLSSAGMTPAEEVIEESSSVSEKPLTRIRQIKHDLRRQNPDLVEINSALKALRRSPTTDEVREAFREVEDLYERKRDEAVAKIKQALRKAKAEMETAVEDPEKFRALADDAEPQYKQHLDRLKALAPTDADLGDYTAAPRRWARKHEEMTVLAGYVKRVNEAWKTAEDAERDNAGTERILEAYQSAQNIAKKACTEPRISRPRLRNRAEGMLSEATRRYEETAERLKTGTTKATGIQAAVDLIIEWRRLIKADPQEGERKVGSFRAWNDDRIAPLNRGVALDILAESLYRKLWTEKVDEYLASADQIFNDPSQDPREAKGYIDRIQTLPGLNNPELGIHLHSDDERKIKNRSAVLAAAEKRENLVIKCADAAREVDILRAHALLQEAEKLWDEEKAIRTPVGSKAAPDFKEPSELISARERLARRVGDRLAEVIDQATERFDSGSWEAVNPLLTEGQELLKLVGFTPHADQQTRLEVLSRELEAAETASTRIAEANGNAHKERAALQRLYTQFEEGEKRVLKWDEFKDLASRLKAHFEADELVNRMEGFAASGASLDIVEDLLGECEAARDAIQASCQVRLEQARIGLVAWQGLRKAQKEKTHPGQAWESLQPALFYEPTREEATKLEATLNAQMISDGAAEDALKKIEEDGANKKTRSAYDTAEHWSNQESRYRSEFRKKLGAIRASWERERTQEMDNLLAQAPLPFGKIKAALDDLRHMKSSLLEDFLEKADLPCAEAEAEFKTRNAPPKGKIPWLEVVQACESAYSLAIKHQAEERAIYWLQQKAEVTKRQVLDEIRRQGAEARLNRLEGLNDDLYGQDAEVWLELGKVQVEIGKAAFEWKQRA